MKCFLKILLLSLVLIFVAVFFAWNMFPSWISAKLSKEAGVTVTICDMRPSFDAIKIDRLNVGNPPGRVLSRALSVQSTYAKAPLTHFLEEEIVIPYMNLKEIYVGLEFDSRTSKKGNWTTIMENLKRATSDPARAKRSLLIKKLVLENLDIELAYTNERGKTKKLKTIKKIEFNNVSSTGGVPTAQIMHLIMKQALLEIFSIENIQNMLQDVLTPSNGIKKTLKGLLGESHEVEKNRPPSS